MYKFEYSPRNIGIYGEKVAHHHLLSKGHRIIARNLRLKSGEIDILTLKNRDIYIIEVKSVCIFTRGFDVNDHKIYDSVRQRDIDFRSEDNLSKTKICKLNRLRRELIYRMNSGTYVTSYLDNSDFGDLGPNIIIEGIAVDIYYDQTKSCVVHIVLRKFPFL